MAGFFERISSGLNKTRQKFQESFNILLDSGLDLDDNFWDGLEEALIASDIGAPATMEIVDNLQDETNRKALEDPYSVFDLLNERISEQFCQGGEEILGGDSSVILFVGINGAGKTTTVGKIAKAYTDAGRNVILGSADTFRAAAIEQLEVWSKRANVEMVTRKRGSDPASVCYDTIERAEAKNSDLVLIDTAGRLHTSKDLMKELEKVCDVTRKRSKMPVYVVLVIDATTGQNGLSQAKEFNDFLKLDGVIITKLDGTAKGGIALAVSKELNLPILKIGVGESIEDLQDFNSQDFARAFLGDLDNRHNKTKVKKSNYVVKKEKNDLEPVIEENTQYSENHEDDEIIENQQNIDVDSIDKEEDIVNENNQEDSNDNIDNELENTQDFKHLGFDENKGDTNKINKVQTINTEDDNNNNDEESPWADFDDNDIEKDDKLSEQVETSDNSNGSNNDPKELEDIDKEIVYDIQEENDDEFDNDIDDTESSSDEDETEDSENTLDSNCEKLQEDEEDNVNISNEADDNENDEEEEDNEEEDDDIWAENSYLDHNKEFKDQFDDSLDDEIDSEYNLKDNEDITEEVDKEEKEETEQKDKKKKGFFRKWFLD